MIEIIPAIDLIGGKCVRLSQGDFSRQVTYSDDPLEVARRFEVAGFKRVHIVDLDGARDGKPRNVSLLSSIVTNTSLTIDFGGGIKTDDDIRSVFDAGAQIVSIGSVAVKNPKRFFGWLEEYGSDKILLGADIRGGKLAINGWQTTTDVDVFEFLEQYFSQGVSQAFVTDIACDGLLQGPSVTCYTQILRRLPGLELIASGGVRTLRDISELEDLGCTGVIVGKAIYEETIRLEDLAMYNKDALEKNNSLP